MKRVRRIVGPAVVPILAVLSAFLVGSVFMFITDIENLKTFPTDPVGTIVAGIGRDRRRLLLPDHRRVRRSDQDHRGDRLE